MDARIKSVLRAKLRIAWCTSTSISNSQNTDRHCEPTGRANARPMTGSAKQSIATPKRKLDCFVAEFIIGPAEGRTRWLLAMTTRHNFAISPRAFARVLAEHPAF
jgi:hypothetical protein